ncbi:uncharacterized protein LOC107040630 [Diachasma alloeum]|uniref:uncharacterized protein LOC107040630 n=1 Tax=Diachasma alloeum TaxID=454923 RepID=UPI0007383E06|nr:uncharacterized protein LOC107040630 [Diachasma alloeum]
MDNLTQQERARAGRYWMLTLILLIIGVFVVLIISAVFVWIPGIFISLLTIIVFVSLWAFIWTSKENPECQPSHVATSTDAPRTIVQRTTEVSRTQLPRTEIPMDIRREWSRDQDSSLASRQNGAVASAPPESRPTDPPPSYATVVGAENGLLEGGIQPPGWRLASLLDAVETIVEIYDNINDNINDDS